MVDKVQAPGQEPYWYMKGAEPYWYLKTNTSWYGSPPAAPQSQWYTFAGSSAGLNAQATAIKAQISSINKWHPPGASGMVRGLIAELDYISNTISNMA